MCAGVSDSGASEQEGLFQTPDVEAAAQQHFSSGEAEGLVLDPGPEAWPAVAVAAAKAGAKAAGAGAAAGGAGALGYNATQAALDAVLGPHPQSGVPEVSLSDRSRPSIEDLLDIHREFDAVAKHRTPAERAAAEHFGSGNAEAMVASPNPEAWPAVAVAAAKGAGKAAVTGGSGAAAAAAVDYAWNAVLGPAFSGADKPEGSVSTGYGIDDLVDIHEAGADAVGQSGRSEVERVAQQAVPGDAGGMIRTHDPEAWPAVVAVAKAGAKAGGAGFVSGAAAGAVDYATESILGVFGTSDTPEGEPTRTPSVTDLIAHHENNSA